LDLADASRRGNLVVEGIPCRVGPLRHLPGVFV
jgi:hypothetical protein